MSFLDLLPRQGFDVGSGTAHSPLSSISDEEPISTPNTTFITGLSSTYTAQSHEYVPPPLREAATLPQLREGITFGMVMNSVFRGRGKIVEPATRSLFRHPLILEVLAYEYYHQRYAMYEAALDAQEGSDHLKRRLSFVTRRSVAIEILHGLHERAARAMARFSLDGIGVFDHPDVHTVRMDGSGFNLHRRRRLDAFFNVLPSLMAEIVFTALVIAHPEQRDYLRSSTFGSAIERDFVKLFQKEWGLARFKSSAHLWKNQYINRFVVNFKRFELISDPKQRKIERDVQKLLRDLKRPRKRDIPPELNALVRRQAMISHVSKRSRAYNSAQEILSLSEGERYQYLKKQHSRTMDYIEDELLKRRQKWDSLKAKHSVWRRSGRVQSARDSLEHHATIRLQIPDRICTPRKRKTVPFDTEARSSLMGSFAHLPPLPHSARSPLRLTTEASTDEGLYHTIQLLPKTPPNRHRILRKAMMQSAREVRSLGEIAADHEESVQLAAKALKVDQSVRRGPDELMGVYGRARRRVADALSGYRAPPPDVDVAIPPGAENKGLAATLVSLTHESRRMLAW